MCTVCAVSDPVLHSVAPTLGLWHTVQFQSRPTPTAVPEMTPDSKGGSGGGGGAAVCDGALAPVVVVALAAVEEALAPVEEARAATITSSRRYLCDMDVGSSAGGDLSCLW